MSQLARPCSAERQVAGPAAAAAGAAERQALSANMLASWRAAAWTRSQAQAVPAGRSSRLVSWHRTRRRQHARGAVASLSSLGSGGGSSGGLDTQQNGSSQGHGQPAPGAATAAPGAAPTGWHPLDAPSIWKVRLQGGTAFNYRRSTEGTRALPPAGCAPSRCTPASGRTFIPGTPVLPTCPTACNQPAVCFLKLSRALRSRLCFGKPRPTP